MNTELNKLVLTLSLGLVFNLLYQVDTKAAQADCTPAKAQEQLDLGYFEFNEHDNQMSVRLTEEGLKETAMICVPDNYLGEPITATAPLKRVNNSTDPDILENYGAFSYSKASEIYFVNPELITHLGDGSFHVTVATNEITLNNITKIPDSAFRKSKFSSIKFDGNKIDSISISSFESSAATNPINLPNITEVFDYSFAQTNFTEINLDPQKITSIGHASFNSTVAEHPLNLPLLENIPSEAFSYSKFKEINLDTNKIKTIGKGSFKSTSDKRPISFPLITEVPKEAFRDSRFTEINLDPNKITSIGEKSFHRARATNIMNLPLITKIPTQAFEQSKFSDLIFTNNIITLLGDNSFSETVAFNIKKYYFPSHNLDSQTTTNFKNGITNTTTITQSGDIYNVVQTGIYTTNRALLVPNHLNLIIGDELTPELISKSIDVSNLTTLVDKVDIKVGGDYTYVSLPYHNSPNTIGSIAHLTAQGVPYIPPVLGSADELFLNLRAGNLVLTRLSLAPITFEIKLGGKLRYESQRFNDIIQVEDSRGTQSGWNLSVAASPLTNSKGHKLNPGSLSIQGLTVADMTQPNNNQAIYTDANYNLIVDNGSKLLFSYDKGGTLQHSFNTISVKVDPSEIRLHSVEGETTESYTTVLTWTISTGP